MNARTSLQSKISPTVQKYGKLHNKDFFGHELVDWFKDIHTRNIGWDIQSLFNDLAEFPATNYPPYNLIETGNGRFVLELAVAGFSENDLRVTLKDQLLKIEGETSVKKEYEEDSYVHKGIAARKFTRQFVTGTDVKVEGVVLRNGILTITCYREIPEAEKEIEIPIMIDVEEAVATDQD